MTGLTEEAPVFLVWYDTNHVLFDFVIISELWLCKSYHKQLICLHFFSLQYVLKPTFTKQHIAGLDKQGKLYRAYDGTTYLPGIVGLNNIKANDYANVVLQVWISTALDFINCCTFFE